MFLLSIAHPHHQHTPKFFKIKEMSHITNYKLLSRILFQYPNSQKKSEIMKKLLIKSIDVIKAFSAQMSSVISPLSIQNSNLLPHYSYLSPSSALLPLTIIQNLFIYMISILSPPPHQIISERIGASPSLFTYTSLVSGILPITPKQAYIKCMNK